MVKHKKRPIQVNISTHSTLKRNVCNLKFSISAHLAEDTDIETMRGSISSTARRTMRSANEYIQKYNIYSYLWIDDRQLCLEQFNKYGRTLTSDEMYNYGTELFDVREVKPPLDKYREKIEHYNALYDEVQELESSHTFHVWLLVDMIYFKQSLLKHISLWSNLYKEHLIDHVINDLQELETFINDGMAILRLEVQQEDLETLLKVMSILSKIKDRQVDTDNMFEPLKNMVDLLKQFSVEFSDSVFEQFTNLPEKWLKMKKMAMSVKQEIAPVQAYQVDLISKRITLFDFRVNLYRENFKELPVNSSQSRMSKRKNKIPIYLFFSSSYSHATTSTKSVMLSQKN